MNIYTIWTSGADIVGSFHTDMNKDLFGEKLHSFQCNRNGGVPTKDADPQEFEALMTEEGFQITYHPNNEDDFQWWIQDR